MERLDFSNPATFPQDIDIDTLCVRNNELYAEGHLSMINRCVSKLYAIAVGESAISESDFSLLSIAYHIVEKEGLLQRLQKVPQFREFYLSLKEKAINDLLQITLGVDITRYDLVGRRYELLNRPPFTDRQKAEIQQLKQRAYITPLQLFGAAIIEKHRKLIAEFILAGFDLNTCVEMATPARAFQPQSALQLAATAIESNSSGTEVDYRRLCSLPKPYKSIEEREAASIPQVSSSIIKAMIRSGADIDSISPFYLMAEAIKYNLPDLLQLLISKIDISRAMRKMEPKVEAKSKWWLENFEEKPSWDQTKENRESVDNQVKRAKLNHSDAVYMCICLSLINKALKKNDFESLKRMHHKFQFFQLCCNYFGHKRFNTKDESKFRFYHITGEDLIQKMLNYDYGDLFDEDCSNKSRVAAEADKKPCSKLLTETISGHKNWQRTAAFLVWMRANQSSPYRGSFLSLFETDMRKFIDFV